MRSLLIAPADEKRLAEALASGADAVIVDLALAAPEKRAAARAAAARFLKQARARDGAPALVIGVNALDSGETDADLDAVMGSAPDAILLPGSLGAASVQQLSAKLAVREADFAVPDGATRIIAVADTARGVLNMASYRGSSSAAGGPRLERRVLTRRHRRRGRPRSVRGLRRRLSPGAGAHASGRGGRRRGGD